MCDLPHDDTLLHLDADEYVLDTPFVRGFIDQVRSRIAGSATPLEACEAIQPLFVETLENEEWLPEAFQRDAPESGMGGGIGQWLLFRARDRSLCLFSLVVPAGAMTPVHDHLAWGLVGLYRGNQDEEFYLPTSGGLRAHAAAPARARGLLQADSAPGRRSPGAHDLGGHLRLDPSARERYRLHPAPHVRRDHGRRARVSLGVRQRRLRGAHRRALTEPRCPRDDPASASTAPSSGSSRAAAVSAISSAATRRSRPSTPISRSCGATGTPRACLLLWRPRPERRRDVGREGLEQARVVLDPELVRDGEEQRVRLADGGVAAELLAIASGSPM